MFRGFTKPRNHSTLRAAQNYNLSFKRQGMTKRSMPCLFHANLFVLDVARCRCQNIGALAAVAQSLGTDINEWSLGTFLNDYSG